MSFGAIFANMSEAYKARVNGALLEEYLNKEVVVVGQIINVCCAFSLALLFFSLSFSDDAEKNNVIELEMILFLP